jgi:hypothetical protein
MVEGVEGIPVVFAVGEVEAGYAERQRFEG